jgi:hypothetical protein
LVQPISGHNGIHLCYWYAKPLWSSKPVALRLDAVLFSSTRKKSMQLIHTAADVAKLADPTLRNLIEATIAALSEDYAYDPEVLGYFLIIEPDDTIAELDAQIGFSILANRWTGIRFDAPGYTQHFEVLDEHAGYFEMLFILSDDGYGIEVFVPKRGVASELLAMCERYAVPSQP